MRKDDNDEPNEVSYAILTISGKTIKKDLQNFASAINLRVAVENRNEIPFIPPENSFNLLHSDKIFLHGPNGSGKSRCVFEIVKGSIHEFERIYIVNPRDARTRNAGRGHPRDIVKDSTENDAIIWDNFPDDLINIDAANLLHVLRLVGSCNAKKILVALKPRYLEIYKNLANKSPEFHSLGVSYSKDQIKQLIKSYGTAIPRFSVVYNRYISKDLEKISRILWQKDPIPLTVWDYYNELIKAEHRHGHSNDDDNISNNLSKSVTYSDSKSKDIEAVLISEKLLGSKSYYDHQFALLCEIQERKDDLEFLYTLKLCYEIGLERKPSSVEMLQKELFGSVCLDPTKRMATWTYLAGQNYSMHDVCREAVSLDSYLKLKILMHLCMKFDKMTTDHPNSINSIGLFLGRNIQYLPRESSDEFVPDTIYKFMKTNVQFEKSFGMGVGEVFETLDESLQDIIFTRVDTEIEFAAGIAESLGNRFLSLESQDRNRILRKMQDVFLFARHFGQSLGRLHRMLPGQVIKDISNHMEHNPQLSDGIGMGIGYIYDILEQKSQKAIFKNAENNSEMMRGLGFGFGQRITNFDPSSLKEIFSMADRYSEFDFGFGFSIGTSYRDLSPELRSKVHDRLLDYPLFSFGVGLYTTFSDPKDYPVEFLDLACRNGDLAFGMGLGFGINIGYLSEESKTDLFRRAGENIRFHIGIGEGIGHIFKHLPSEMQKKLLKETDQDGTLGEGIAMGIGNTWNYNGKTVKEAALNKAKTNSLFAQGLGHGLGFHYNYYDDKTRGDILNLGKSNSRLDKGLGFGIGMIFPYLGVREKEILVHAMTNSSFAHGLGEGIGFILKYLTPQRKKKIFSIATSNGMLTRGLGQGIGTYTLPHASKDLQDEIFAKCMGDEEFACGLGEGIGYSFRYFPLEFQNNVLAKLADKNIKFARGLGAGFGRSLDHMPRQFREEVFKRAKDNTFFAEGLGDGIGQIFSYLGDTLQKDVLLQAASPSAFSRGLGIGLGFTFYYLSEELQKETLKQMVQNVQFSRGLGIGLGFTFYYLSEELQKETIQRAKDNTFFAEGLGDGIGQIFSYLGDKNTKTKRMMTIKISQLLKNSHFIKGMGSGMARCYYYNGLALEKTIQSWLRKANPHFSIGFGIGTATTVLYTDKIEMKMTARSHQQVYLMQEAKRNVEFAEAFGFGLAHIFQFLDRDQRDNAFANSINNRNLAYGLGNGLGHNFPFLDVQFQEEVFEKAKRLNNVGYGLGVGLGKTFNHLQKVVQLTMLESIATDSAFAYGLGNGLGHNFPLLSEQLQRKLLAAFTEKNHCLFSVAFVNALNNSQAYLQPGVREQVTSILNERRQKQSSTGAETTFSLLELANNSEIERRFGLASPSLSREDYESLYREFPCKSLGNGVDGDDGSTDIQDLLFPTSSQEIVFLGKRQNCCVCFIDIVGSTKIASMLEDQQIEGYYAIFLNAMATIAKNFGGSIIKNAGDALILYFPHTADSDDDPMKFKNVLECGITMIKAHKAISARLFEDNLPPLNYRISVEYGLVEVARSESSKNLDLFGPAMNLCSKINSKAESNGMVIGHGLYQKVKLFADSYYFRPSEGYSQSGSETAPSIYHVKDKQSRTILDPFKHRPEE